MSLYSMEFDMVTSFLGEEPTLWATERDDLFKVQGTEHGSSASLADELLGEIDGQCIKESSHFEDLPEWMSEKIALTEWIDAADIMPPDLLTTVPLSLSEGPVEPAEELLQLLMVDERIPPQPPSPGEQKAPDLLALYPAAPLCSPDSPLSQTSEDSLTFQNSVGSSYSPSPYDSKPKSPEVPLTAEEYLWQIADGLTSIFSNDILNDTKTDLESQPVSESRSSSPLSVSGEEDPKLLEAATPQKKSRAKPKLKTVSDPGIKKTKKRDQNKVAATRYRVKKRGEANVLLSEQMKLEEKNTKLNDKVESLSREIKYLNDLMVEVCKVKGELKILMK